MSARVTKYFYQFTLSLGMFALSGLSLVNFAHAKNDSTLAFGTFAYSYSLQAEFSKGLISTSPAASTVPSNPLIDEKGDRL